jgi:hypothetical protein
MSYSLQALRLKIEEESLPPRDLLNLLNSLSRILRENEFKPIEEIESSFEEKANLVLNTLLDKSYNGIK